MTSSQASTPPPSRRRLDGDPGAVRDRARRAASIRLRLAAGASAKEDAPNDPGGLTETPVGHADPSERRPATSAATAALEPDLRPGSDTELDPETPSPGAAQISNTPDPSSETFGGRKNSALSIAVGAEFASVAAARTGTAKTAGDTVFLMGAALASLGAAAAFGAVLANFLMGGPVAAAVSQGGSDAPAALLGAEADEPDPAWRRERLAFEGREPTSDWSAAPNADLGQIATASISPYLSDESLAALLRRRPVQCVLDAPPPAVEAAGVRILGPVEAAVLQGAANAATGCAEVTVYRTETAMLTRHVSKRGSMVEINTAFRVKDGALCHQSRGAGALALDSSLGVAEAAALEAAASSPYAALGGAEVCYRLQPLGQGVHGPLFRADAYVRGVFAESFSDRRPFVMRRL